MTLTDAQYAALMALYNECNADFWLIRQEMRTAFFNRLFDRS